MGKAELGPCKPATLPSNRAYPKCTNCRSRNVPCSWGTLLPPALNDLKMRVHQDPSSRRPRRLTIVIKKPSQPSQSDTIEPPSPPVAGPSRLSAASTKVSTRASKLSALNFYDPNADLSKEDLLEVTGEALNLALANQDLALLQLRKASKDVYMQPVAKE